MLCCPPSFRVEALEPRHLLSVMPAGPINVVGQFTGTADLVFSPRKSHSPMSDSLSLTISSESPKGLLQGVLNDALSFGRAVSGRLRGKHLTLRLTADTSSVKDRGRITATVTSDGRTLTGRIHESELEPRPSKTWGGGFTLGWFSEPVPQGPAPHNLLGTWQGRLSAVQSELITEPTAYSYTQPATFTVTSESADGSFAATLLGLFAYFDHPVAVSGTLIGGNITLTFAGVYVISQSSTATVTSDWKSISGSLYFDEPPPLGYMSLSATFTLQRVQWPVS